MSTKHHVLRGAVLAAGFVAIASMSCRSGTDSRQASAGRGGDSDPNPTPGGNGDDPGSSGSKPSSPIDESEANVVNHVLGTGQSLSLGGMGTPALSTNQPFENVMFDTGLAPGAAPTAFVPLRETNTFLGSVVETMSSGMANLVTLLSRERLSKRHDLLVSLHGVSGASYPMIMKGTEAYENGLAQVRAAKGIAESRGKQYVVRAITVVHGESDGWQNWDTEYDRALLEWQSDYDTDIRAITGQSDTVPMFQSQYNAWTPVETTPTNVIPTLQLAAHVRAAGRIVLVGPKYVFPYVPDGLHLTNEGYRWLGEYYAKAYLKQVVEKQPWEPVRPRAISRSGATISAQFFVPVPPLVIDTQRVSDPGQNGFEVTVDGVSVPVSRVDVTSADTVTLTLASAPPDGAAVRLRYAFTGVPGNLGGPTSGPRGNLRDSDPTPSRFGHDLFDWCVTFDEAIP